MQKFPHYYTVRAEGQPSGTLTTQAEGLTALDVAAPQQFDGPGDKWSPEDLLVACAADCLILTFRAVANASQLKWRNLTCEARGPGGPVYRAGDGGPGHPVYRAAHDRLA